MKSLFTLICSWIFLGYASASTAWVDDGQRLIHAQLATTDTARAKGLMYRIWLFPYSGMLFVFQPAQPVSFWMKNTLIPLDIRFYDARGIPVAHYPYAMPCTQAPCPLYPGKKNVAYVLETRAAYAPVSSASAIKHLLIR